MKKSFIFSSLALFFFSFIALVSWNPNFLFNSTSSLTNNVIFKKATFNPREVAVSTSSFVDEYNPVCKQNSVKVPSAPNGKWEPPPVGTVKLNIDAGCWENGTTGFGMVARDSSGSVIFAASRFEQKKWSPTLAEALALRWSLSWAREQNFDRLVIESDAETVVKCFHGGSTLAEIENIIMDCKELVSSMRNTSLCAVKRGRNAAAHGLVGVAKELGSNVWTACVPSQIESIICNELLSDQ